jgi:hypothetical protein
MLWNLIKLCERGTRQSFKKKKRKEKKFKSSFLAILSSQDVDVPYTTEPSWAPPCTCIRAYTTTTSRSRVPLSLHRGLWAAHLWGPRVDPATPARQRPPREPVDRRRQSHESRVVEPPERTCAVCTSICPAAAYCRAVIHHLFFKKKKRERSCSNFAFYMYWWVNFNSLPFFFRWLL